MATFFPHLYEYSKAVALIKEYEEKKTRKRCIKNEPADILRLSKLSPTFDQVYQSQDIEFLSFLELKSQKLRESNYNPINYYEESLKFILKERTELSNADKYSKPKDWPINYKISHETWKLSREEFTRHWLIEDAILCVEMAKILPFFLKLNSNDQEQVLRATVLPNITLMGAFYSTVAGYDSLYFPDGLMPIKFYVKKFPFHIFYRILEPIKRIKVTKEEYVLLKTIIYCSAKSDSISEEGRKILQKEFHRYSNLLLKYSQAKLGAAPGAVRFSQLISIIEAMTYFAKERKDLYLLMTMFEPNFIFKKKLLDEIMLSA